VFALAKFCVLVPISDPADVDADPRVESLRRQSNSDWVAYLLPHDSSGNPTSPGMDDERIKVGPAGLDTFPKLMNWALENGGGELILPLPHGVTLMPFALERFAAAFDRPEVAGAFSSYQERDANGEMNKVQLYPHEGAPHERFDFGYVKVYRADRLREIGGVRSDLQHAGEYDTDLKLCDKYTIELVDEVLYEAAAADSQGAEKGALHSPGKGKLGGFSYIFYPADLEKEITTTFEEMLHRRGAHIGHDTVPVQYPAKPYPVLATVIIPVFNRVTFIGNAIERVLEGTFQDFEVLVIDNGSSDGTQNKVMEYVKKDKRVRLLAQTGPSISFALNCGIRAARGKYICQLDSDDEYTPDTLELMVGHMESHPKCGLAISYYELMDENRGKVEGIDPVTHSGYTRNQILRRDGAGALRVFPKVVLEEMGLYDEENFGNFGEDYDMVLKVGEKYDVDRVHKVLYRYRRHSDNTDVTRDPLMKVQNKNNARLNAIKRRQQLNKAAGKA